VFLFPWKFGEVVIVFFFTLLDLASLVFFLPEEFGKVLLFISLTLLLLDITEQSAKYGVHAICELDILSLSFNF
jgi:cbb3-type cytochrome oxidase subunit 1